jgi:hypothetical protein
MGLNIKEIYDTNPSTSLTTGSLMYLGKAPYAPADSSAILVQDLTNTILQGKNANLDGLSGLDNTKRGAVIQTGPGDYYVSSKKTFATSSIDNVINNIQWGDLVVMTSASAKVISVDITSFPDGYTFYVLCTNTSIAGTLTINPIGAAVYGQAVFPAPVDTSGYFIIQVTRIDSVTIFAQAVYNQSRLLPLAGGTMTGALTLSGDATTGLQAVTFQQLQNSIDLYAKPACALSTTAPLTATYNNGTAGVGATLTNSGTQIAFAADGFTASLNDVILVKNQSNQAHNGIYVLTNTGSGSTNWILTRANYYDTAFEIVAGSFVIIKNGVTNAGSLWYQTNASFGAMGVSNISFAQINITTKESLSNKDSSSGYVGLTGYNINFKDSTGINLSSLTNNATAPRIFTFQDRNGTIIDNTDLDYIGVRHAVRSATTANLTATYNNGTAGVGATLTNSGAQAALAFDGVTFSVGDRVLIKDQTTQTQNGIYVVTNVGSGSTNWVLTRAIDFNLPSQIFRGLIIPVFEGIENGLTQYIQAAVEPVTIGTINIFFYNNVPRLPVSGSFNLSFSGAWSGGPFSIQYRYSKSLKVVTLGFLDIIASATAAATLISTTAIDSTFRPSLKHDEVVRVTNNNAQPAGAGLLRVRTDGFIEIYRDNAGTSFTNNANCGLQGKWTTYGTA